MWVRRLIVYYLLSANPDPEDDPEANASVGVGHLKSIIPRKRNVTVVKSRVE